MRCRLGSVVLVGFVLLGESAFVKGAYNPIRQANSAFYLTHGAYDDAFDRFNERFGLNILMRNPFSESICAAPRCSTTKRYRSYSGACAGIDPVNKPLPGARHQCHRRLLPSSYIDRVSNPPKWVDVATIFNVMQSLRMPSNFSRENSPSGMFAMVGQFFANDITDTALARIVDSQRNFDCCDQLHRLLPQCSLRIDVSEAIGYEDVGVKCMSFIRAARCPCSEGTVRESMNLETAYIDLSHVYSNRPQRDAQEPWRLASSKGTDFNGLPMIDPNPTVCYGEKCFRGDRRMNQQQGLSLHYVIFERLHNQMANELRKLKESWSPNRVFEEARKLVIARWQYVVFNEFLAILIDSQELRKRHIDIDSLMSGTQPDSNAQTVTYVESVYSAFREYGLVPDTFNKESFIWLDSSSYFHTDNFTSKIASAQWSSAGKPFFPLADSVGFNFLRHPNESIGLSMLLMDVQRSRDVGMPSLKDIMEWAYNTTIDSFDSVAELGVYTKDHLDLLRSIYNDRVDRVDMFIAGHLQLPHGTGILSFAHQKINLEQLYGQVYGDRFFFSHRSVFTAEQRRAIADASSYSQILCETLELDEVTKTPFVFRAQPAMIRCTDMEPFNYEVFV